MKIGLHAERTAELLGALALPYALIGGAAMVARVRVRPTEDCDVLIPFTPGVEEILRVARSRGFTHAEDAASLSLFEAGLIRLSLPTGSDMDPGVDLIACDSPFLERVLDRASDVDLGIATLRVASVEDLLLLKLEANRPIDLDDAIAIKDAFGDELDRAYLAAQGDALGLRRALENLLGPL